jgi:hypothetical protein
VTFSREFSTVPPFPGEKARPLAFKKGEGTGGVCWGSYGIVQIEDVTRDDHFSKSIDELPGIMTRSMLSRSPGRERAIGGSDRGHNTKDGRPFSSDDGVALAGMALLGAAALEKVQTHLNLQDTTRAVLGAVADLIETRGVVFRGGPIGFGGGCWLWAKF